MYNLLRAHVANDLRPRELWRLFVLITDSARVSMSGRAVELYRLSSARCAKVRDVRIIAVGGSAWHAKFGVRLVSWPGRLRAAGNDFASGGNDAFDR